MPLDGLLQKNAEEVKGGAGDKAGALAAWIEGDRPRVAALRADRAASGAPRD